MTTGRLDQRVALHTMINELFDAGEMRDLYHECGLNYDDETGDKSNRIWNLIDFFAKREVVLSQKCNAQKPGNEWPFHTNGASLE